MAAAVQDPNRAAVAFGRQAVPQLFEQLQQRDAPCSLRVLTSLCDLVHEPERLYQIVTGGNRAEPDTQSTNRAAEGSSTADPSRESFIAQLQDLLKDEDPSVRTKTCELLHLLTSHSIGRLALLSSSLLPPLSDLLDDSSSSCRRNVHLVLNGLAQMPAGAQALLMLVPKLMLKLRQMEEEQEEEEALLLSTLSSCSRLDPLPALASDGVPVLGHTLSHCSPNICREATEVLMAL
ncbi:hypothetical protein GOODEAATRI_028971, partial [Goodea atripinnis]